jgi:cholesterol transport system auxiliary component
MMRRSLLSLSLLAGGCSILPDRPFIESRRFPLEPRRPAGGGRPPASGRPRHALLLRTMRAAPGLEQRGLRRLRADGTVDIAPYEEWLAPPADLAELALREWLASSGRFTAVAAPGSRLLTTLILETTLLVLQVEPGGARAAVSALLLAPLQTEGEPRPRGQRRLEATVSLAEGADAAAQADAMRAALAGVFAEMESWIVSVV